MEKWRHLRMTTFGSKIDIFPASCVDFTWLFNQFPKIKKSKDSNNSQISIEVPEKDLHIIEESILHFLEDSGWEAYSSVPNWNFIALNEKKNNTWLIG